MSRANLRQRVLSSLMVITTALAPGHFIDCDWDEGELEIDWPKIYVDDDDCDCCGGGWFFYEKECWGWWC